MVRIIVGIDGMACEMCEAHVNDTIRKNFQVQKVKSSHRKKEAEIIAEAEIDAEAIKKAITPLGFTVTDVKSEPYEKKSFSLFK
ncbi:MAG: ATPase P [Ruminococcaceae bacterium]|nr:ATPase P [Oscillospiraceae bacterium]